MIYLPLGGLVLGVILRVVVPYLRSGLQAVAEAKTWRVWPAWSWGYGAMVLLPLVEYGVAFLTVPGLWVAMFAWQFIPAVGLGYTSTDLSKELIQGGAAVYRVVEQQVAARQAWRD